MRIREIFYRLEQVQPGFFASNMVFTGLANSLFTSLEIGDVAIEHFVYLFTLTLQFLEKSLRNIPCFIGKDNVTKGFFQGAACVVAKSDTS